MSYASSNYKGLHGLGPTDPEHGRAEGLQAVVLMSRSSFSLVYRCSIEGYQDTLDAGDLEKAAPSTLYLDTLEPSS